MLKCIPYERKTDTMAVGNGFIRSGRSGMHKCIPYGRETDFQA